jgi:hypothetical protein
MPNFITLAKIAKFCITNSESVVILDDNQFVSSGFHHQSKVLLTAQIALANPVEKPHRAHLEVRGG